MFFKKIKKNPLIRKILGKLIYFYIRFCYSTTKWKIVPPADELLDTPLIYAFWHSNLAMMPYMRLSKRFGMNILISDHSDGEIIRNATNSFGFNSISGSTRRHSMVALRQILRAANNNENIAITPDGPRGPAMKINSNIIEIAKITHLPIMPISYSIKRYYQINSWDKFIFPFPFNEGVLVYGKAIYVNNDSDVSLVKNELEQELLRITEVGGEAIAR